MLLDGKKCFFLVCAGFLLSTALCLAAETVQAAEIPVTSVTLYSSGVGYFEHTGAVSGNAETTLSFNRAAVNDVLKSLVITDPGSGSPSVTYSSEDTLARTLKSLKIDLSGNPGVAEILAGLRGADLQIYTPELVSGRIIGVETRIKKNSGDENSSNKTESFLSLNTKDGIRVFSLNEISSFTFTDKKIAEDLSRALDIILSSRDTETKMLHINLPGKGERNISFGYVIAAPVWKVSYRLDLANEKPFLQGWAIVDNAGNMDWSNVQLSLVTGRPVSFIQNLYPPLNLSRPEVPLSIAGIADAVTYDSGYGNAKSEVNADELAEFDAEKSAPAPVAMAKSMWTSTQKAKKETLSGVGLETALARSAGEQFAFTVKKPVSLARLQSAMIPLVEGAVKARKVSVFSGEKALNVGSVHPMLCAELTNTTGMKLPAGPVTVFDDGIYAGDALIEFFPENDRRIIAFGEDLSVTGSLSALSSQETVSVTVSHGIMTISRRNTYAKKYSIRNSSASPRLLVIEHPITGGTTLAQPAKYDERTDSVYRFSQTIPANSEIQLEVKEQSPVAETVLLSKLQLDAILYYRSSGDVPAKVKAALDKAIEFKKKSDDAQSVLTGLETRKNDKIAEQDRIRSNLEAAGNETQQGKDYLRKLSATDAEIDSLSTGMETARKNVQDTKVAYENYLSTLTLE